MKIIQILNSPNWSGASNYCISVSRQLIELGHEVLLLTEPGKPAYKAEKAGIPMDTSIRLNHRNPYLYLHAMKRMKHIFRQFKPDFISAHINEGAWMAGMIAKKYCPESLVVRVRTDIDPPKGHFINRYVHHEWTDHLVVGSMNHKKLCHEILDYPEDKISIVYGGVDTEKFCPRNNVNDYFRKDINIGDNEILIGLLARLDPVKGHEYALEAIKLLNEDPEIDVPFKLVALGYENERTFKWLHKLAQNLGIGDRVISFGLRKDIAGILAELDIGLITSIGSEANSRAALEFMSCAKPVVGTSVGVIPEIVSNNKEGFIVPPENPVKIAEKLKQIITNASLRNKLGINARKKVEEKFSLYKFGKAMETVYKNLL
jgi:glycosyltransferase involved in cell wall biosynthesis